MHSMHVCMYVLCNVQFHMLPLANQIRTVALELGHKTPCCQYTTRVKSHPKSTTIELD